MLDSMPYKPSKTDLDFQENPEYLEALDKERARTGKGYVALIEVGNFARKLTKNRIKNILEGKVRYVDRAEYKALLKTYELFPTMERIDLTPQKLNKLKSLIEEKGIKKAHIAKSLPRYLNFTSQDFYYWFNRTYKTADKRVFDLVMDFVEGYEPPKKSIE